MKKPAPFVIECRIPADERWPATRWQPIDHFTEEFRADASCTKRRQDSEHSGVKLEFRVQAVLAGVAP